MSIPYTYKIIKVDESARCMEVVYTSDDHQTMHISARLPYEGETLEEVIAMFSPVALWEERQRRVMLPAVGATGTVAPMAAGSQSQVSASSPKVIATTLV